MAPLRVFVSYAPNDSPLKELFDVNLKVLSLRNLIALPPARQVEDGQCWNEETAEAMREADVIIFLVSNAFLVSDYIRQHEMPFAVAQVNAGRAVIIPVILRECAWEEEEWSVHQALPMGVKPIAEWPDVEAAFTAVEKGLRKVLRRLRDQKEAAPSPSPSIDPPDARPPLSSPWEPLPADLSQPGLTAARKKSRFPGSPQAWIGAGAALVLVLAGFSFMLWRKHHSSPTASQPAGAGKSIAPVVAVTSPALSRAAATPSSTPNANAALMKALGNFVTPIPATPTPAVSGPANLREALLTYSWLWTDTNTGHHRPVNFLRDGTFFVNVGKPCHYQVMSAQTIEVVMNNQYKTTLFFDKSLKTFTNNRQMNGTRMGRRLAMKEVLDWHP